MPYRRNQRNLCGKSTRRRRTAPQARPVRTPRRLHLRRGIFRDGPGTAMSLLQVEPVASVLLTASPGHENAEARESHPSSLRWTRDPNQRYRCKAPSHPLLSGPRRQDQARLPIGDCRPVPVPGFDEPARIGTLSLTLHPNPTSSLDALAQLCHRCFSPSCRGHISL